MSRRLAAVLLSAATLLSACGTGLQAQTYKETGRGDGAAVDLETLAIRNLHLEPPTSGSTIAAGGQAVLTGTLVNRGSTPDSLTQVSSDAASTATLMQGGKPAPAIAVPAGGSSGDWTAVLYGLKAPLRAGGYVTVTLTFTNGGLSTLSVPLRIGDAGLSTREVNQEPYGEGG